MDGSIDHENHSTRINQENREKIDIEGLNHPKRMFDLTEGLLRRKYSDAEVEGILGGNFERVLCQIWTA